MRLDGKVVLVVGGAGAIGATICGALLEAGAAIGVVDLRADELARLESDLGADRAAAQFVTADCSDIHAITAAVESIRGTHGRIDAGVNLAGTFWSQDFATSESDSWWRMLSSNLLTVMAPCRALLPIMLEQGKGSIVNIASTAGEYGSIRPAAAYAAAKGGVIAFTKSLAREVSPRGVRVNCVSPGPIRTPMFGDAAAAEGAARTLVGRMGLPRDLIHPIIYLLSDESSFVTGTVMRINGGSLL